ncbi:hypothetical protein BGZ65_007143, partial [Modicella reniformis]
MLKAARDAGDPSSSGEEGNSSSSSSKHSTKVDSKNIKMTRPTRDNPCAEDKPKYLDISELQNSKG